MCNCDYMIVGIDILLGIFIPMKGSYHVWEVDQRPQLMRRPRDIESCLIPFLLPIDRDNETSSKINLEPYHIAAATTAVQEVGQSLVIAIGESK